MTVKDVKNDVDDDNEDNKGNKGQEKSLLDSVRADLNKSEKDSVKGKLKELLKSRLGHEKAIKQLDVEINKLIDDFQNGVL
jgi:hypothetical protein